MSDETGLICVVCCQRTSNTNKKWIYAIGRCDHTVCYECSTRMRVLCQQNECPICRQLLDEVVFTSYKHKKFEEFDLKKCLYHNNYGIHFDDEEALEAYGKLLEHPCRRCKNRRPFKTFHDLTTHLRKEHELFLCDLCVSNLKVFSHERKYYNRKELARHRKSGDPDERSHRGHPNCTFCDQRYVDEDDLNMHLRREHFYCHFCDPSGLSHFYGDYSALRDHFLSDHYLCKECDTQEEKFTNAFRSEIDLQAHITQHHSQNMSKADLKKAKTLTLDLFIRQRSGQPLDNGQQTKKQIKKEQRRHPNCDDTDDDFGNDESASGATASAALPPRPEDFPSLCTNATNASTVLTPNTNELKQTVKPNKKSSTYSIYVSQNPKLNTTNDEEFPALPGSKGPQINASNAMTYKKIAKQKASNVQITSSQTSVNLIHSSMISTPLTNQKSKQNLNKPLINNKEEFPSLPVTKKKNSRNSGQSSGQHKSNTKSDETIEWTNSSKLENKNPKNDLKINNFEPKILSLRSEKSLKSVPNVDDFPVLETHVKKVSNNVTPPPRAASKQASQPKASNPPPGLSAVKKKYSNLSLSSVAQEVITTSGADNQMESSDTECLNGKEFYYMNPIDFNERNQSLVKEVETVLGDFAKFLLFKESSKQFRQSLITSQQYYQKCIELFGRNNFKTIFCELLVLLPDIRKQNELLMAQQMELKSSRGAVPKGYKLTDCLSKEFITCQKCQQVLIARDESHHMSTH